jgi:hypothetical protein
MFTNKFSERQSSLYSFSKYPSIAFDHKLDSLFAGFAIRNQRRTSGRNDWNIPCSKPLSTRIPSPTVVDILNVQRWKKIIP